MANLLDATLTKTGGVLLRFNLQTCQHSTAYVDIARTPGAAFSYIGMHPCASADSHRSDLIFFRRSLRRRRIGFRGPRSSSIRRELTPDLIPEADVSFAVTGSTARISTFARRMERFSALEVRPKNPNGAGSSSSCVADTASRHRPIGIPAARRLHVVMMDARPRRQRRPSPLTAG